MITPTPPTPALDDIQRCVNQLREDASKPEFSNDACLFVDIPHEWRVAAYSLLACPPSDVIILQKIRAEFKHRDLLCLQPHQWLNDEVVNGYMQLAQERDSSIIYIHEIPIYS